MGEGGKLPAAEQVMCSTQEVAFNHLMGIDLFFTDTPFNPNLGSRRLSSTKIGICSVSLSCI